jgi:hypothetical protein
VTGFVDPDTIVWVARRLVVQHAEQAERIAEGAIPFRLTDVPARASGSCRHCTPDGCRMLAWAEAELAALRGVS